MHWFIRFLYDKEFLSLNGVVRTQVHIAAVTGALLAARVLLRDPSVVARNIDPVGCIDVAQFHESYSRRGLVFPEKLKQQLGGLIPQAPKPVPATVTGTAYAGMPHY